jgi:hypothetical protein
MITYNLFFSAFLFLGQIREICTHVKRLSKPARIMVEKGTASLSRVDEINAVKRGGLWRGLLDHEWFKCGVEAQQRCKGDVH